MLKDVIANFKENEKPTIHSDRECRHRWLEWIKLMNDNGFTRSMSKKGCSPDNSAFEEFFWKIKEWIFYNRDWINTCTDEFINKLNEYINWYNSKRIKE